MSAEQRFNVPGSGAAPHQLQLQHRQQPPPPPPPTAAAACPPQAYDPQLSQQPFQPDASAAKLTRGTSCVLCQQRKVRCDKNKPCANCVKAGAECRVVPPQPPRRRKKRLQEKDLVERLKKYEGLLAQHGVKFDAIDQDLRGDGHGVDEVEELENDFEALKTSPEASTSPSVASHAERSRGPWFSLHKEFRASEQLLHDSSDEDTEGPNIYRGFDSMFGNQDGLPIILGGPPIGVTDCHPSTIHILQLWQIYIDNINPLLKLTHVPSIQARIIEATSRLDQPPRNMEALMFGIYLMAVSSMEEADVLRTFGESKQELHGRYLAALQQALNNASFMRVADPLTLQAFLLYLLILRWFVDPRQTFCLIGIAVRIAQRMGLHRDPGGHGLPPFEVEQRRRLWWTIVGYDRRVGEMTGSTVTALTSGCDCKMPLNVNDSDLHMDGKEPPTPHTGPTEMLFALTRVELAMAIASSSSCDGFKANPEKNSPSSHTGSSGATTIRLAGQDSPPYTLEGFCAHMEGTYLTNCDPKIPLHLFTLTMTRQALCKMRVVNFLVRSHSSESMPLKDIERDNIFQHAIQMIEYDNLAQSSEVLRPFRWFAMHHFPFPAYMFLGTELRRRIAGPLVKRGWEAIEANYHLRQLLSNPQLPMHSTLSNLLVKAWLAYENAQRAAGNEVVMPRFIYSIRERVEEKRKARLESRPGQSIEQATPVSLPHTRACEYTSTPENMTRVTPSVDPTAGVGIMPPAMAPHGTMPAEDNDMDWSHLIAGYQDIGAFQGFNAFGDGFDNPVSGIGDNGGMAGFGGYGGGNMFSNKREQHFPP